MSAKQYRINIPQVTFEVFDDEIILINFESGAYFSLNPTGSAILAILQAGATEAEAVRALRARGCKEGSAVAQDVQRLLDELRREQLITPRDGDLSPDACPPIPKPPATADTAPYEPPALHKYSDMEDLIMLDPIHEVDETGWPSKNPEIPKLKS